MTLKNLYIFVGVIVYISLLLTLGTSLGSQFETSSTPIGRVESISVYFNEEGTEATEFTAAVYSTSGTKIAETQSASITKGSWCNANFSSPVFLTNEKPYIFMVSANGNYSVGGDTATDYTIESMSSYGDFQNPLSDPQTGTLDIKANFV